MDAEFSEALVIKPGDTLVLRCQRRLSAQEVDTFQTMLRQRIPESIDILILDGIDQMAVIRP